jgi:hypothetical protein
LFIFLTEERAARILQRDGGPEYSGSDETQATDILSRFDAVGMLAGPREKLRQRHDT